MPVYEGLVKYDGVPERQRGIFTVLPRARETIEIMFDNEVDVSDSFVLATPWHQRKNDYRLADASIIAVPNPDRKKNMIFYVSRHLGVIFRVDTDRH